MNTENYVDWNDRDDQQNYPNTNVTNKPEYDDLGGEDDDDIVGNDDLDDTDELSIGGDELEDDEFTEVDDDELDELDDDEADDELTASANGNGLNTAGNVNLLNNDAAFNMSYDETEGSEFDEDKDFEAHLAPESVDPDPNEIPEKQESEQEGSGYSPSREYSQPQEGNDASYSEQTDVTPPNHKEFPAEGPAKADFEARNHGRTTGRMIGHEPGTEGI